MDSPNQTAATERPGGGFGGLFAATFVFFLAAMSLIPVIPKHAEDLGASPTMVGLVVGIMWVPAIFLRPVAGRLIDKFGRRPILIIGAVVQAGVITTQALWPTLWPILIARLFHGLAIACFFSAASTMAGDKAPADQRAQVLSRFTIFVFLGFAVGPALGEHIFLHWGAVWAFYCAAGVAIAACVGALTCTETLSDTAERTTGPLLSRAAYVPGLIAGLATVAAGTAEAYVPLYVRAHGDGDARAFFIVFALALVIVRSFAGKVADTHGRGWLIVPGCLIAFMSMVLLSLSAAWINVLIAAVLFGIGWGAIFPGVFAILLDRADEGQRGAAIGTFGALYDLGFGGGQIAMGGLLATLGYAGVFLGAGGFCLMAIAVFVVDSMRTRRPAVP